MPKGCYRGPAACPSFDSSSRSSRRYSRSIRNTFPDAKRRKTIPGSHGTGYYSSIDNLAGAGARYAQ